MEELLPLSYHAEELVIEDDDLYIGFELHDGAKFLQCHLETTVADDRNSLSAWVTISGSDSCGECKSHGTQAATCNVAACVIEFRITAGYHLVLTYIGNNDRVTFCQCIQFFQYFAHGENISGRVQLIFYDFIFLFLLKFFKLLQPCRINFLFDQFSKERQSFFTIAPNRYS